MGNHHINPSAQIPQRSTQGQVILSCEEQPLLMATPDDKSKGRKRKRPESDNDDDEFIITKLNQDGFDEYTLINEEEYLPDHDKEFAEWLHFTKQLWKRQRKYKNCILTKEQKEILKLE